MFQKEAKIMALMLMGPIVLALIAALSAPKILRTPCENQVIKTYPSPDNKFEIVVFLRHCGETTGASTQVSIIKTGENLPKKAGNVFIACAGEKSIPLGPLGDPAVEIKWTAQDKIIIEYTKESCVCSNENQYKNIQIEYKNR